MTLQGYIRFNIKHFVVYTNAKIHSFVTVLVDIFIAESLLIIITSVHYLKIHHRHIVYSCGSGKRILRLSQPATKLIIKKPNEHCQGHIPSHKYSPNII